MISQICAFWRRAGWTEFVMLVGVFTLCMGVWVFLEMADDAVPGEYLAMEETILRLVRDPHDLGKGIGPAWLPPVAVFITELGGKPVLIGLPLVAIAYLLWSRRKRAALLMAGVALGGLLLIVVFKHFFDRPRPQVVPHLVPVSSPSFPSGHSMMSAVIYLSIAVLLTEAARRRRVKAIFIPSALLLSCLIGLSRVYLGVHYPTDVVAGWAAGTAWALLCWGMAHFLQECGKLDPG